MADNLLDRKMVERAGLPKLFPDVSKDIEVSKTLNALNDFIFGNPIAKSYKSFPKAKRFRSVLSELSRLVKKEEPFFGSISEVVEKAMQDGIDFDSIENIAKQNLKPWTSSYMYDNSYYPSGWYTEKEGSLSPLETADMLMSINGGLDTPAMNLREYIRKAASSYKHNMGELDAAKQKAIYEKAMEELIRRQLILFDDVVDPRYYGDEFLNGYDPVEKFIERPDFKDEGYYNLGDWEWPKLY